MPAIITHDQFGQEALRRFGNTLFASEDERLAFRLGNQGPDPLFYCVGKPTLYPYRRTGNIMHDILPSDLLANVSTAARAVPEADRAVAQAYAAGFLCHYLLDRTAHPLVYFNQYSLCDAGVEGLDSRDGSDVHAVIEAEIDEMMLYTRLGETVATYKPYKEILQCSEESLAVISGVVARAVKETYGNSVPDTLFSDSVHCFRRIQHGFYSRRGIKRTMMGSVEKLFRRHSFVRAMSHRPVELEHSMFDNSEHATWENPFTQAKTRASFMDLFELAQGVAEEAVPVFLSDEFDAQVARQITQGLNFSGKPVE